MSDDEFIDMAHTILLRMAMRGGHDAYTGALLHKWLKAHESRQAKRPLYFTICTPEYHALLDEAGDRFCRMCGQPLSQ